MLENIEESIEGDDACPEKQLGSKGMLGLELTDLLENKGCLVTGSS